MWLAITQLQEGMVLETDLQDQQGQTLLPGGAKLTQSILENLEKEGITTVDIVQDEQDPNFMLKYFQNDSVFRNKSNEERMELLFINTDRKCAFMRDLMDFKKEKLKQMEA